MKESFDELYKLLKLDREKSHWSRNNTLKSRVEELQKEVDEVFTAIEKNDLENLAEELGDVLWDVLAVMIIGEEKGFFSTKDIIHGAIAKMKRRKPFLLEDKEVSLEDEHKIWFAAKAKEKETKENKK